MIWKWLTGRYRRNVITDHCTSFLYVRNNTSMWEHTKLSTDKAFCLDLVLPSSARWNHTICAILWLFLYRQPEMLQEEKCVPRCHSSWKLTRLPVLKASNLVSFHHMQGIYLMSCCTLTYFSLLPLTMHTQAISHSLHNSLRDVWAVEAVCSTYYMHGLYL